MRPLKLFLLFNLVVPLSLTGCFNAKPDPDAMNDVDAVDLTDTTNPCPRQGECTVLGASCNDDVLTQCQTDLTNLACMVQTVTNCALVPDGTCDIVPGEVNPICTGVTCTNECEIGPPSCEGNTIVACIDGPNGCTEAVSTPCPDGFECSLQGCIPSTDPCAGTQRCPAEDLGTWCTGTDQSLITCDVVEGCLTITNVTDCADNGEFCEPLTLGGATCEPTCTDAPECSTGARQVCMQGDFLLSCEDTDQDGCLEYDLQSCAPGTCEMGVCMEAGAGDLCSDPRLMVTDQITFTGTFLDYADAVGPLGTGCVDLGGGSRRDLIIEFSLDAGESMLLSEHGPADVVLSVVESCAEAAQCLVSEDLLLDETGGMYFTAEVAGTYFAIVEAYAAGEIRDFEVRLQKQPCGNGVLDPGERCDDGNIAPGDGCSQCQVDFGFQCDAGAPSACTPQDSLGTLDSGQRVSKMSGPLPAGASDFYLIEFASNVSLGGILDGWSMGDADLYLVNAQGVTIFASTTTGPEAFTTQLNSGLYQLEVHAYLGSGTVDSYTLSLETAP